MAEPKFEEYTQPVQTLANGKTFVVRDQLAQTRQRYLETRTIYNLSQRTQKDTPRIIKAPLKSRSGRPPGPEPKYTPEDCAWILAHTIEEVALRYGITRQQVYAIRFYARRLIRV